MIRLANSVLVFLLVAVALIGYGAKEETRALRAEIAALEKRKRAVEADIRLWRAEWDYVTSAPVLIDTAQRLYGDEGLRDPEGAALGPWRIDQVRRLVPTPAVRTTSQTPPLNGAEIETASIPEPEAEPVRAETEAAR